MKSLAPVLALFIGAAPTLAQTNPATPPAPAQAPLPTLRAQAKLVVVDVVVTDKSHAPVKGLKREDFTLIEDKAPQKIASFEEHTALAPGESVKFPPLPKMPPGIFANLTPVPTNSAVNVLLLDALNTPLADQDYLHKQLLHYVETARPGTSIAVFGLNQRLVMLQGFTSDPAVLRLAAEKQIGHSSPLLTDPIGNSGGGGNAADSAASLASAFGGVGSAQVAASLQSLGSQITSGQQEQRAKLTLDAMNILAHYLSSLPGRKNLVWFAGSFPLDLGTGISAGQFSNPFADMPTGEQEYRETVNLLARSQVAVYPIDARGLMTNPQFQAAGGSAMTSPIPNDSFAQQNANEHDTMRRIATDTGGHAFYNVNDLSQALDNAITEGSNYYTLTYTPTNSNWKGDFRKIQVALAEKGVELAYRHGYYAADPDSKLSALTNASSASGDASPAQVVLSPLPRAMIHGTPGPSEILFKVRVLPAKLTDDKPAPNNIYTPAGLAQAKSSFRRYLVDFNAEGHNFTFTPTPDGKFHVKAEFAILVYQQSDGVLVDTVSSTLVADITAAQRATILQAGFPFHFEVSVPSRGEHTLRIGIHDFSSDHVGSLELPISAVAGLPPVDAAPLKELSLQTRPPAK
jgi:VWFA-related protein